MTTTAPAATTPATTAPRVAPPPAPRLRSWWPDAVGALTWAVTLFVIALWVNGGGPADLVAGTGPALVSVARLSGLLAAVLLLLQVLGMARVPWAERSFGQDRLARWHRLTGLWSFALMLTHLAAAVAGYAVTFGTGPLAELWDMVTTMGGMLLALAGLVLLMMVVVTSWRVSRRRLRYESWHLLHLYGYLGVALVVPHMVWTGTDLLAHPWVSAVWVALWVAALGAVLVWRVVVPLATSARHRIRVASVVTAAPDVVTITMTGRGLGRLAVAPGQYFVFRFRTGPGWTRGHPLSLSAAPDGRSLRVTMGVSGDDGPRIAGMRPGMGVLVEGPYGRLTPAVRTRSRVAAFGAGLGVAPLVALLDTTVGEVPTTLVQRVSDPDDPVLGEDLALLRDRGLHHVRLAGPRAANGTRWLPAQHGDLPGPEAIRRVLGDPGAHDVYVCGPATWSDLVVADLRAAGVPRSAIHIERFDW